MERSGSLGAALFHLFDHAGALSLLLGDDRGSHACDRSLPQRPLGPGGQDCAGRDNRFRLLRSAAMDRPQSTRVPHISSELRIPKTIEALLPLVLDGIFGKASRGGFPLAAAGK